MNNQIKCNQVLADQGKEQPAQSTVTRFSIFQVKILGFPAFENNCVDFAPPVREGEYYFTARSSSCKNSGDSRMARRRIYLNVFTINKKKKEK